MKIQVSFERTTKKEFRDLCVQRLKNFVRRIKESENSKSSLLLKQNLHLKNTQLQRQVQQIKYEIVNKAKYALIQNSQGLKQQKLYIKKEQKSDRIEEKYNLQASQKQEGTNINRTTVDFNIQFIKHSISKIMQKLERQHQENSMKSKQLEQQVYTTNQKLNTLIQELTHKKVIKKRQNTCQHQQSETDRNNYFFLQKFNELQSKYKEIKNNSLSNSFYRQGYKKYIYSMQQTNDSLLFGRKD